MFGLCFFVGGILTNCCCPEPERPLHCLDICAQPYQRFNTYCFKLHQSLPPALALSILPRLIFLCLFLLLCLFIFLSFNFSSHYSNSRCLFIIFLFPLFHSYPLYPDSLQFCPSSVFSLFSGWLCSSLWILFLSCPFNLFPVFSFFLPVFKELG